MINSRYAVKTPNSGTYFGPSWVPCFPVQKYEGRSAVAGRVPSAGGPGRAGFTTDDFKPRWLPLPEGRFQLWFVPELGKYAPPDLYVVSADIGMGLGGSGGSNSALTVLNRRTMRKVASFVVSNMLPYLFAEMAIAACWWFKNDRGQPAFLAWEANGPGQEFQQLARLNQPPGQLDVLVARLRVAAGVVVAENHRLRGDPDRRPKDLARVHDRLIEQAQRHQLDSQDVVLGVQKHGPEMFLRLVNLPLRIRPRPAALALWSLLDRESTDSS